MRRKPHLIPGLALGFGLVLATAGCSSDGDGGKAAAPPPVAAVPQLTTMSGQALPLERYMLQPDQFAKIMNARESMVVRCMKRFGYDYKFDHSGPARPSASKSQSELRYVLDPETAAAYGYHSAASSVPDSGDGGAEENLSAAEEAVLGGTDAGSGQAAPNGAKIPDGGCFGEADAALSERGAIITDDELVTRINAENMQRSIQDPRVKEAFGAWSACMNRRGYSYPTPLDAGRDPRWTESPTASAQEIATAVADTACMMENNVVGVWFAVETAYQKQAIEENFEKLEEIRKAIDTSVRVADEVAATA